MWPTYTDRRDGAACPDARRRRREMSDTSRRRRSAQSRIALSRPEPVAVAGCTSDPCRLGLTPQVGVVLPDLGEVAFGMDGGEHGSAFRDVRGGRVGVMDGSRRRSTGSARGTHAVGPPLRGGPAPVSRARPAWPVAGRPTGADRAREGPKRPGGDDVGRQPVPGRTAPPGSATVCMQVMRIESIIVRGPPFGVGAPGRSRGDQQCRRTTPADASRFPAPERRPLCATLATPGDTPAAGSRPVPSARGRLRDPASPDPARPGAGRP